MSVWSMIRDGRAAAALAVCQAVGVVIELVHEGSTVSGLAALPNGEARDDDRDATAGKAFGTTVERTFRLPRQDGFTGAVRPGDVVVYPAGGATKYVVRSWDCDAYEAVYRLRTTRLASPVGLLGNRR